jgi:hypothetical protein
MRRYLIPILAILVLVSVLAAGCGEQLQVFSKHGISFKVSNNLNLEEYTVNMKDLTFHKGAASYEQGAVISAEKNFYLLWLTTVPQYTPEEIRYSILSTPNAFVSPSGSSKAEIAGDLSTQQIAGFDVTFAEMRFTLSGMKAPGITALWYCPASHRTMQLILISSP